jgi:hypothetical protein
MSGQVPRAGKYPGAETVESTLGAKEFERRA